MYRIRQQFDNTTLNDIRKEVLEQLSKLSWNQVQPGHSVAIAAGSRGIANIAEVLKSVVAFFKALDARPFIFPAMGSHGAATAAGQKRVLAHLGIVEEDVGAPIRSSLEVMPIGKT